MLLNENVLIVLVARNAGQECSELLNDDVPSDQNGMEKLHVNKLS